MKLHVLLDIYIAQNKLTREYYKMNEQQQTNKPDVDGSRNKISQVSYV